MKRTLIDRAIGIISPRAEYDRILKRAQIEAREELNRAYDVAKTFPTSEWVQANKSSANESLKSAIAPGREKARSLVENAPYGNKAVDVIVNDVVGAGIIPRISGRNKSQTKKLNELWKMWAESTLCDYDGESNYYQLQELAMRSTVEAGEGLAIKKFPSVKEGIKIQLLEPDHIATEKDDEKVSQGVERVNGRRTKYHLFATHPGDKKSSSEVVTVEADSVAHVFRKKRAGQVRGITWAHAVIEKMKDFDDYQYSTLVRQKVAACFGGLITTTGNQANVNPAALKERRENEFSMQPNTFRYLNPGEDFKLISPPGVDGYSEFNREALRSVAAGWGISYEALTGDYSQVNFTSGRMGQIQFRKNLESWRWNMFIPQFCEPTFKWFLEWVQMTAGIDPKDVTVRWVPPAFTMLDPTKEIPALMKEVRSGFKSFGEALLEQGRDPDEVLEDIAQWNKKFDEKGVVLDIDPRKITQAGLTQAIVDASDQSRDFEKSETEVKISE